MPTQVTVKSGDTLSQIAQDYGIDMGSISGYRSGDPNLIFPGEVLTLSDVGTSIAAENIRPSTGVDLPAQGAQEARGTSSLFGDQDSVTSQVDRYRKEIEGVIGGRLGDVTARLDELRKKEQETLGQVEMLTQPFREELETAERERLYINENFEANQQLINELDSLLTEGNRLIEQQREVTGLAAIRNPRIQQTMNDVAARAGVIEAVINARNGQIAVAENLIDRTVMAIAADRNDQLTYYETVLNLNNRDIISLDKEAQKLADFQVSLIERDLKRAEDTADEIKKNLADPAKAALMGEAGVSLNDSIEEINAKLTKAQHNRDIRKFSNDISLAGGTSVVDPSTVPADQLVTYTDAVGKKHYYKLPRDTTGDSGAIISAEDPRVQAWAMAIRNGAATLAQVPASLKTSVAAAIGGEDAAAGGLDMTFEQYLDAAQETAQMTFVPDVRDELKVQYDRLSAQAKEAKGSQEIQDWVTAINLGYATVAQVPEEIRPQVLRAISVSAE